MLSIAVHCDMGTNPACLVYGPIRATRKGARGAARRDGWQKIGRTDVCPKCHRATLTILDKESK